MKTYKSLIVWIFGILLVTAPSFAQEQAKTEEETPPQRRTVLPAPDRGPDEGVSGA